MSTVKHVNVLINPQNIESQSKRIVRLLSELGVISFPFSPKDEPKIKVKKFTDGLSNILVGVYHEENPEEIIMVRVYGEAVSDLVDRKTELDTMVLLSSVGLSNKLFATFENGFCYEYLNGRVLDTDLVRNERVSKLVARALAKLHTLKLGSSKEKIESGLMKRMKKFLDSIPDDLQLEPIIKPEKDSNNNEGQLMRGEVLVTKDGLIRKAQLAKEVSYVERSHLIRTEKDIVFCHNDTLPKNLILSKDHSKVLIIDLEYADYNGRGFELADHLIEFCGIDFDTTKYPSEGFIRKFINNYVTAIKRINMRNRSSHPVPDGTELSHPVPDETELYVKIQMYACIVNLFWALWSLVMSNDPATKSFDYKEYAMKRLKEYYRRKVYLL